MNSLRQSAGGLAHCGPGREEWTPHGGAELNVLGIDVGGTKVAVAQVDGVAVVESVEHPTELSSSEALLDGIEGAVAEVTAKSGPPDAIGVGVPSQVDHASGRVIASVNIPLAGIPLREELGRRLGAPVVVDNDANVAGLCEALLVPDGPARHLVMLTLGTGVGGGIVIDGRVFRGATGLGAELGHITIDARETDPFGTRAQPGTLEALCSGTALEGQASRMAAERPGSKLAGAAAGNGGRVTGRQAVALAGEGDADALELMDTLGRHLGIGIANVVNAFEPEHVVIGGGLSRAGDLFIDRARREAEARALPALFANVTISLARGGAEAGVIGAGALAAQELQPEKTTAERAI
ncbi:MAG TPA: ROK family protein [Thermoleophilaceae bacterium]|nr:ROK family protein [Thermoleophilaceae bacterium]